MDDDEKIEVTNLASTRREYYYTSSCCDYGTDRYFGPMPAIDWAEFQIRKCDYCSTRQKGLHNCFNCGAPP